MKSILILFLLTPLNIAWAQQGNYGGWHMRPGDMMVGWGMGWMHMIFMIVFYFTRKILYIFYNLFLILRIIFLLLELCI